MTISLILLINWDNLIAVAIVLCEQALIHYHVGGYSTLTAWYHGNTNLCPVETIGHVN